MTELLIQKSCLFCRDRVFLCCDRISLIPEQFCRDRILFCHDILFFSGPCRLLSCLLRQRNLCCDTLDLANLSSHKIYVTTDFSFIVTEFYHSQAFIVTTKNFFGTIEIPPSILYYVATWIFFVAIPIVSLFNFLSQQRIHLPHVLFVIKKIIFVAIEILP